MTQDDSLRIGATLQKDKFVVRRILGQGGFGITYEVEQVNIEKRVVLKELFISGTCDRDDDGNTVVVLRSSRVFFQKQKQRFLNEAKRMAKLNNSHIVQVHDIFEENGTAYYVMDFIEGESLSALLKRTGKPLEEAKVMDILQQMLDALGCIHKQKPPLCHLDIKPANIMMDGDKVMLIDFGASKYVSTADEEQSLSSSFAYTPGFAPIEQLDGVREDMGPWTDFYALGATLFNLLTGERPASLSVIDDDPTPDKRYSIPMPSSISPRMRQLVLWMMSRKKNKRPKTVEEIWAFLKEEDENTIICGEEDSDTTEQSDNFNLTDYSKASKIEEPFEDEVVSLDSKDVLFSEEDSKCPTGSVGNDGTISGSHSNVHDGLQQFGKILSKRKVLYSFTLVLVIFIGCWIIHLWIKEMKGSATQKLISSSEQTTLPPNVEASSANTPIPPPINCPDDNHPHAIDLGLPSSTKWACCNIGANKPEEEGGYYAWGETEVKEVYDLSSYIHSSPGISYHDLGDRICGTQYDVAHMKWDGRWEMPSVDQNKELIDNCTYYWTTKDGVKGAQFTSKINNNSIFLPACGRIYGDKHNDYGTDGNYWSGTHSKNYCYAYGLSFSAVKTRFDDSWIRCYGHSVRAVCK